jgi:hypothetical protein
MPSPKDLHVMKIIVKVSKIRFTIVCPTLRRNNSTNIETKRPPRYSTDLKLTATPVTFSELFNLIVDLIYYIQSYVKRGKAARA